MIFSRVTFGSTQFCPDKPPWNIWFCFQNILGSHYHERMFWAVDVDVCLSEATERREAALERQTSPSQLPTALLTLEGMTSYRRIEEAFHCKLKGPVVVDKKTLVELQNFQTVCLFETECLWAGTVLLPERGWKSFGYYASVGLHALFLTHLPPRL